jgi:hypothetical protein
MAISSTQLHWGRILILIVGGCALLYSFWPVQSGHISIAQPQRAWAWDDLATIENQTLGVSLYFGLNKRLLKLTAIQFGKVFAINLPNRLDKRDNIVLGSSVSNFQVEFLDGVTPEEVHPKTYPYVWHGEKEPPAI